MASTMPTPTSQSPPTRHDSPNQVLDGGVVDPVPTPSDEDLLRDMLASSSGNIEEVWPTGGKLPELADNQKRVIKSILQEPKITFSEREELVRAGNKLRPASFYRTYYETSKTACCYVNKDTHPQHREVPDLKISDENAFQSIGTFSLPEDLTRERIERHLIWNKKVNPSSFISVFNHIRHAKRRAAFHYEDSQRIGMRVSIAKISTEGLIPATVRANMETTIKVTTKNRLELDTIEEAIKVHKVRIPIWVRDTARPADGSSITDVQLAASGADMWLSITEFRVSDLKKVLPKIRRWDTIAANGHDYEWLACGAIPKSRIMRVMPWDGVMLHETQDYRIVRSIDSSDPWVFDWNTLMWRLDARLYRTACFLSTYGGNKRKIYIDGRSIVFKGDPITKQRKTFKVMKSKAQKGGHVPKSKRNHNPYDPDFTPDTSEQSEEVAGCCSHCGQKKSPFHLDEEINGPLSYLDLAVASTPSRR